jgi:hypothetical protein
LFDPPYHSFVSVPLPRVGVATPTKQHLLIGVAGARSRVRLLGITDVGQESHLARAFDRDRDLVLVLAARPRVAAPPNLAALGDETAELRDVLVVNCCDLFSAEET